MEKRFVLFIVLSLAVLTSYALIKSVVDPAKPAVAKKDPADSPADQEPEDDPDRPAAESDNDDPSKQGEPAAGDENASPETTPDQAEPGPSEPAVGDGEPAENGEPPETVASRDAWPDRWISLGSYEAGSSAAASPPFLITLNARGGVVERVELTERVANGSLRYRELLDRTGYLGHMALTTDPDGGCYVNVVGRGTPAALATNATSPGQPGLQIGDVIHHADGDPISTPDNLRAFLKKTKPGQPIRLGVRRAPAAAEVVLTATLGTHPLQLIQPERPLHTDKSVPLHPKSFLFSLLQIGDTNKAATGTRELALDKSMRRDNWEMVPVENGVEFHLEVSSKDANGVPIKLEVVKHFRLGKSQDPDQLAYHLEYDVEIKNLSNKPHRIAYRQDGPNGLPLEGFWYSNKLHPTMFYVAGARDVVWKTQSRGGPDGDEVLRSFDHELIGCSEIHKTAVKAAKKNKSPETVLFAANASEEGERMPLYAAIDTQYFLAAMKPMGARQAVYDSAAAYVLGDVENVPKAAKKSTNVSFHLDSHPHLIDGGSSLKQSFQLYLGPKVTETLAVYELQDCIYYGWFGTVSKLLAVVLHFFFAVVKNFGVAIIMLTVLVRSGMFPLSRKAAKNAAMMQALAPQMKKITEKYKDDMERRAKAQQDLFKKHNYNPFGGCWMMFLQLPIFIGLYRCLSVDINLRQAALIPGITWCSNLAGPDMLFEWPEMFSWDMFTVLGMLGPYFNILPMFTVALFLVQQKLFTPPPTDDQSKMQLTMMKYMTVFIGVMFFKVASGLCLYFIASSLWGIAERKLLPKPKLAADDGSGSEPLPAKPKPKPRPRPKLPDNTKSGKSKKKRR